MSTISGTSTIEVTLNPTSPNVTITGTIQAFGPAGIYSDFGSMGTASFATAVFGATGPDFRVHNQGLLKTHIADRTDVGILLGSVGTIFNTGTVKGGSGAAIFGSSEGAYVLNRGLIEANATNGVGIFEQGAGAAVNAGTIIANAGFGAFGIDLYGASHADNRGLISSSGDGIYIGGSIGAGAENSGVINAGSVGIYLRHGGIITNTGQIHATENVIRSFGTSQIDNNGIMSGGAIGVEFTTGILDNRGTISGNYVAIGDGYQNSTNVSDIYNFRTGHISANLAIQLYGTSYLYNAGVISAFQQAILAKGSAFSIFNTGTIEATYADAIQVLGSLKLTNAGLIEGPQGLLAFGSAEVDNRGSIIGTSDQAVFGYGTMQFNNQGEVSGGKIGVLAEGELTLNNTGKILSALGTGLAAFGTASVWNTGLVEGGNTGITIVGSLAMVNAGTVEGLSENGIAVVGATAAIGNSGLILGGLAGVGGSGPALSVSNTGTIAGTFGAGIDFNGNTTIVNDRLITGLDQGVSIAGYLSLANSGQIMGRLATGIAVAGSAYITSTGDIISLKNGVSATGALTLQNGGTITGMYGNAVYAGEAALITNSGLIEAKGVGISVVKNLSLSNSGTISGNVAIDMFGPSYAVTIDNSGLIEGVLDAINVADALTLENSGTVASRNGIGVSMWGGQATNAAGGLIEGLIGIAVYTASGSITNNGIIAGSGVGIDIGHGGTIFDSGTISGPNAAIRFTYSYNNRLIITSGAALIGSVAMGGGTLELGSGGAVGTVNLGAEFTGLNAVRIDPHAIWDFAGPTIAATLQITNDGKIEAGKAEIQTIDAALSGRGTVEIGAHSVALDGTVGSGQKIAFSGAGETLSVGQLSTFEGRLANFAVGETIDLSGIAFSSIEETAFSSGILTIATNINTYNLTFANPNAFGADHFNVFADGHGTGITLSAAQMKFVSPTVASTFQTTIAPRSSAMPLEAVPNAFEKGATIAAIPYGWWVNDRLQPEPLSILHAFTLQS